MRYGFVIDNTRCIGCHACSTACKSENDVPLGVYRTWVKYVETGAYPNTRRHFQVTRCNHCENPPCVRICPVGAMYQRADGIVEFDKDICIGCKACLQACPYDSIHIDPSSGTASKCHYCSHRVDIGLEPACVVVCPTQAIVAGDLDDADSDISRVLGREKTTVRRPEQGTAPKLFYVDGLDASLHPTAVQNDDDNAFMWADIAAHNNAPTPTPTLTLRNPSGANGVRKPRNGSAKLPSSTLGAQGAPEQALPMRSARMAEQMVQVAYNAQHQVPWHWQVPGYLVTKAIASGSLLVLGLASLLGVAASGAFSLGAALVSLLFLGATTALLVADLEQPKRFLSIIFRPQWKSWLTRGAFILVGFAGVATAYAAIEGGVAWGLLGAGTAASLRPWLLGLNVVLAVGAAVYTGFLFAQAEGRDLWQSPLLPIHLVVQAVMMGGAALLVLAFALGDSAWLARARVIFAAALGVDLLMLLWGELGVAHASDSAARAAKEITSGRFRNHFWIGAVLVGHVAPAALLLLTATPLLWALASGAAVVGLYLYEHAFVMAPQQVPNS